MYICKTCGVTLIPDNMYSKIKCKKCYNDYMLEYRNKNREKFRTYMKEYMRKMRDYSDVPKLISRNGKLCVYLNGEKLV